MTSPRDLFSAVDDGPEPPLRGSAEVLGQARRVARRRGRVQGLMSALVLVLVIGGAALVIPRLSAPLRPPAPLAASAPAVPDTILPSVPSARSAHAHGASIDEILMAAVPAGYAAEPATLTGGASGKTPVSFAWVVDVAKGHYREASLVRVSAGGGVGMLMALVGNDVASPAAGVDPCAIRRDLGIEGATDLTCYQVFVGGTAIRVVTGRDAALGTVESAVRFIRGGYVAVVFSQGVRAYRSHMTDSGPIWQVLVNPSNETPLATMPITPGGIAELAADPGLLP